MIFDAVVLAGGRGRRLGGADKAALDLAGTTSLDRVLAAVSDARTSVVVGPRRPTLPTQAPVRWTLEQPRHSGPASALRTGVAMTGAPMVVVLATDVPLVDASLVHDLVRAAHGHDGALLVDDDGRDQPLVGAYRRRALAGRPGRSLRAMLAPLDLLRLADDRRLSRDIDTADDLAEVRAQMAARLRG